MIKNAIKLKKMVDNKDIQKINTIYNTEIINFLCEYASGIGNIEVLLFLLNKKQNYISYNCNAISHSIFNNQLNTLKFLINTKLYTFNKVVGLIELASEVGHVKIVEYLLSLKNNGLMDNKNKALEIAVKKEKNIKIVELLLRHGYTPEDSTIRFCAEVCHLDILRILILHKYRVNNLKTKG